MSSLYPRNDPTSGCTVETSYKLISNPKFSFGDIIGNSFHFPPIVVHFKKSFYKLLKIELIYVLRKACPQINV